MRVSGYDAFISYSHQSDRALGPALQSGLERLAKPWYKIRALRIFLDKANLSASPELWAAIEDALGSSEWFILLASADAAKSVWVDREVQWWLDHRSLDRLLVVGTSPGMAWDGKKRDWAAGAPVPSALRGASTKEPYWIDLGDTPLDRRGHPIPIDQIAAVAASIRGIPKDMLVGEHLREHRHAMRLAGGAVAMLTVLLVLAVAASFIAIGQRDNAIRQRNQAVANRNQAVANEITDVADRLSATDQSLAAALDVAANQFSPTPDTETRLINAAAVPLSRPLTGPQGQTTAVTFSPGKTILATGGQDAKVWLWNTANPAVPVRIGRPLTDPGGLIHSLAFSPDGKLLAAGTIGIIAGSRKLTAAIELWNVADPARPVWIGQLLAGTREGYFLSVAFSPDGQTLAGGSELGKVWLYNMTDPAHPAQFGRPLTGPQSVNSVAFSPDGRILIGGDFNRKVWLWNVTDPARPTRVGKPLPSPDSVSSVAFSPDGRTLAVVSSKVWLWNVTNPARPTQIGKPLNSPDISSVTFSPDGRTLAAGGVSKVWLWDVTDPAQPALIGQPLSSSAEFIFSVAFGPDGKTLVSCCSSNNTLLLWNLSSGVLTGFLDYANSLTFSPDGRTLAAGTGDGKVWLWDVADPAHRVRISQPLAGPVGSINSLAFSPDGRTLAAGSVAMPSEISKVWRWNISDPAHPTRLGQPLPVPDNLNTLAFSPDGRTLLTVDSNKIWLWNMADPAQPVRIAQPLTAEGDYFGAAVFSPDGRILAVGSTNDGKVWLWNMTAPYRPVRMAQPLTMPIDPAGGIGSVSFSPDGRTLTASTENSKIWLWNMADLDRPTQIGQPLIARVSTGNLVDSVVFSPDGRTLVATSSDHKVWLWNITDLHRPTQMGQPLTPPGYLDTLAFSPDGRTIAIGGEDTVQMLNLDVDNAIQRICETTRNVLTSAQWKQYFPDLPFNPPCARLGHYGLLVP